MRKFSSVITNFSSVYCEAWDNTECPVAIQSARTKHRLGSRVFGVVLDSDLWHTNTVEAADLVLNYAQTDSQGLP